MALLTYSQHCCNRTVKEALTHDKAEENTIVALADTIVDPGAMMVESLDAPIAETAVETPRCANQATF